MFRKNLLLLSMNFVLQTKKSELTRSKLILTLQNGILSCNSASAAKNEKGLDIFVRAVIIVLTFRMGSHALQLNIINRNKSQANVRLVVA